MDPSSGKIWTVPYVMALINNFFLFLAFYALLTLLPVYVMDEMNGTEEQAGLVTTAFLLSAILIRPFSAKIIEQLGKRRTLITSVFAYGVATLLHAFVDNYQLLLSLRFFHGLCFGIVSTVVLSLAADLVPPKRSGEGLGYFAISMNLAAVFGPFVAFTAVQFVSYQSLFLGLAAAICAGLLCTLGIKSHALNVPAVTERKRLTVSDLFEGRAVPIAIVGFLSAFAYASVISFISVYAKSRGMLDSVSWFFVLFAAAMLISRPYTGRLFDRRGPRFVINPSLVIFAAGLFCVSMTNSTGMLLVSGVLIGLGYGALLPCFQAVAIQASPKHRSGHATATFFTLYDCGIAIGAYVLGLLSATMEYAMLYVVCGTLTLFTLLVFRKVDNHYRRSARASARHAEPATLQHEPVSHS